MIFEQSQTNLALRSESRTDVRRISGTTRLTDVDCGKYLVLALADDTNLILPDASSCIGGQVDGMVVENDGAHTLTIIGDQGSNDQLVGNYAGASLNVDGDAFGPHPNVPVGFGFSLVSTGKQWCIRVSGSPVTSSSTPDLAGLSASVETVSGVTYSKLSSATNGIKLSPGPGCSIIMNTSNLVCPNTITAASIVGQIATQTQNGIRSIQDVMFETTPGTAMVQSGAGKDLVLSSPIGKKVFLDGIVEVNDIKVNQKLDLNSQDILNVKNLQAQTLAGTLTTGAQPNITSIGNLTFSEESKPGITSKVSISTAGGALLKLRSLGAIQLEAPIVQCTDMIVSNLTSSNINGSLSNPTQNNIASIRDVFFETTPVVASLRSGTGKDLRLTCPSDKEVIIDGNLKVSGVINGNLDLNNQDIVNVKDLTAQTITGTLTSGAQPNITGIGNLTFSSTANQEGFRTALFDNLLFESGNSGAQISTPSLKDLNLVSGSNILRLLSNVFTNNLDVNGGLTVSGNITCDNGFANLPRLSKRKLTPQSIPSFSDTKISWDSDATSYPSASISNADTIHFNVITAGFYLVTWTVDFGNSSTSADLYTYLHIESTPLTEQFGKVKVPGSTRGVTVSSSATVYMEASQKLRVFVGHGHTSSIDVPSSSGSAQNYVMQITIIKQM
jgi:hypothetical protein